MNALRKIWRWYEDRAGTTELVKSLFLHPVPARSKWWYVFGSAILVSFISQVITGMVLASVYIPSGGHAFASVRFITDQAPFGRLVRGMHYFGASAMVLFVGVHMIRVYLMGAYKFPRELNWITGVVLLALTVIMGFTGQVIRWDQSAIWSIVVGAGQAVRTPLIGNWLERFIISGPTLGSETVTHLFALHVFIFPVLLVAAIAFHLHLVLRHGVSEPPVKGQPVDPKTYRSWYDNLLKNTGHPFWPGSAWRDVVFGTFVVTGIVVLALIYGPKVMDNPPDPALIKAQPRPDWYLLWYFAILALVPHEAEDYEMILVPLFGFLFLFSVPLWSKGKGERSWQHRFWAPLIVLFIILCVGVLWQLGDKEPWKPNFSARPLSIEAIGAESGPIYRGGLVFNSKGCVFCHKVADRGGTRGPDLTFVGNRLTENQLVIRVLNGGYNMPSYAKILTPEELNDLTAFLQSRKKNP